MQSLADLNENFSLPDVLAFDEPHAGMPRLRVTTPACHAELFLQGAHLTQWQPAERMEALYLSEQSSLVPGKAIRGGIPIVFPWFASPASSPVHPPANAPSHGFARTAAWSLRFAALAGEDLHLSLTLDQPESLETYGFHDFELAYELILGHTLTARLSVANTGEQPLFFEEALHAYLVVGDSSSVKVEGLKDTEYLDKTQDFRRETQTDGALRFKGETDRAYLNTTAELTLEDAVLRRRLHLAKAGSKTTVTWNPGAALSAKLPDLAPDGWRRFVCLETANAAENAVTLRPREAHVMEMRLSIEPF